MWSLRRSRPGCPRSAILWDGWRCLMCCAQALFIKWVPYGNHSIRGLLLSLPALSGTARESCASTHNTVTGGSRSSWDQAGLALEGPVLGSARPSCARWYLHPERLHWARVLHIQVSNAKISPSAPLLYSVCVTLLFTSWRQWLSDGSLSRQV